MTRRTASAPTARSLRRPRTPKLALVGVAAAALVLSACGARLTPPQREAAANAQLAVGGLGGAAGTGGAGGGSTDSLAGGSSTGPGAAGGTGTTTTTGGSTGAGAGGGTAGRGTVAGGGAPAAGGGHTAAGGCTAAGSSDVGVTPTTITIGNVSTESGPVPGLFSGAAVGTQAYVNYINSQGGVCGRQLKLQVADDQLSCSGNSAGYQSLEKSAFAFVGSFSLYDNCGATVLSASPTVPNVAYLLSPQALAVSNSFSPAPNPPGYADGMFAYMATKFGGAVQAVGTLEPNIASAQAQQTSIQNAAVSQGWKFIYSDQYSATQTDFTSDIIRMKAAGVKLIFIAAADANDTAIIRQDALQQGFNVPFVSPVAYDSNFINEAGGPSTANGVFGYSLYALFFSAADASAIPAVATYQQWMKRTNPGQALDLFSLYGWASAQLFVQALQASAASPTRAAVLAALKGVTKFDGSGLLAPANPAGRQAPTCYVLWQISGGQYARVDSPGSGFRCDGGFHN